MWISNGMAVSAICYVSNDITTYAILPLSWFMNHYCYCHFSDLLLETLYFCNFFFCISAFLFDVRRFAIIIFHNLQCVFLGERRSFGSHSFYAIYSYLLIEWKCWHACVPMCLACLFVDACLWLILHTCWTILLSSYFSFLFFLK